MNYLLIAIVSFLVPIQNEMITSDHLKVFEGDWNGTLTYLNYGDDETLVDLSFTMQAVFDGKSLDFDYFYDEGDGRIEKRTGKFSLKGEDIQFNGKWQVEEVLIESLDRWQLQLSSKGKDNNRKAAFKQSVLVTPNRIEVVKNVKYLDTDGDYFMRNRHVFTR